MADTKGVDMKQFTEDGLLEISGLISRREYNRGMVRARQLADRLVRNYATENQIEYSTMADTIERLYAAGAINMTSRDDLHSLRTYGNKAVREADDSEEDAESAYSLLKTEVETYHARKQVSVERTPLRVERPSARTTSAQRAASAGGDAGTQSRRSDKSRTAGTSSSKSRRSSSGSSRGEITIYDVLKVLMPIIAVILLVIIIRSLLPSKQSTTPETTPAAVEETMEETEAPTEAPTEPETEAAPTVYEISADNVNVRYADNQNRIYTQLSRGTYIGEVTDVESTVAGVTFVGFTMDGLDLVVSKDYITPVTAEE